MYEVYGAVKVPTYVPYFPCAEEVIGTYTVHKFDDYPKNHTALIEQHIQDMVDKLVAAGYDPYMIDTDMCNKGYSDEFGEVRVDDERVIIRVRYEY